jgi:biotin carboxyl carrier protein
MARPLNAVPLATRIAPGTFRVVTDGTVQTVYVAGPADDRWAFWNGHVFRPAQAPAGTDVSTGEPRAAAAHSLTSPMPATVIRVAVKSGERVQKGDTLVVLEAMKMELPVRALSAATVRSIHCREGELVRADQVLIDLE